MENEQICNNRESTQADIARWEVRRLERLSDAVKRVREATEAALLALHYPSHTPGWEDSYAHTKLQEMRAILIDVTGGEEEPLTFRSHFADCYKKTPTSARILTEQDMQERQGIIHTLEGDQSFQVGDYLARDPKGEWPIRHAKMERDYRQTSEPGPDGFAEYTCWDVRKACQFPLPFTTDRLSGSLKGKPGDYLVVGRDSEWVVDRELFERTYALVANEEGGHHE